MGLHLVVPGLVSALSQDHLSTAALFVEDKWACVANGKCFAYGSVHALHCVHPQEMAAVAEAEAAAKEQCRAAQEEAEGHLAVLAAKQQQDDVLKGEIERLSSDLKEAEFERLSTGDKDREIEALQVQLQEAGMQPVVSVRRQVGCVRRCL